MNFEVIIQGIEALSVANTMDEINSAFDHPEWPNHIKYEQVKMQKTCPILEDLLDHL